MARTITRSPSKAADTEEEASPRRTRRAGSARKDEPRRAPASDGSIAEGWEAFEEYAKETASVFFTEDSQAD